MSTITILPALLLSCTALVSMILVMTALWKMGLSGSGTGLRKRVVRIGLPWILGVLVWVLLLGMLSLRGFFIDFLSLPPHIGLAVLLPLPIVLILVFSKKGKGLLRVIPAQWPIYLQVFRIVVEMAIWLLVRAGALPQQMSFEGRNFDILTGLLALPVGYYCFVRKSWPSWVALAYNIAGLLLLVNIVAISTLSMPGPLRSFHNGPDSSLLGQFPFIYLPGLLVPLAYFLHIFSIRQYYSFRWNSDPTIEYGPFTSPHPHSGR